MEVIHWWWVFLQWYVGAISTTEIICTPKNEQVSVNWFRVLVGIVVHGLTNLSN